MKKNGKLGLGHQNFKNTLTPMVGLNENVTRISLVSTSSLILMNNTVYGFGTGSDGQLGIGTALTVNTVPTRAETDVMEISAGFRHSLILNKNGSVLASGYNLVRK